MNYRHAYHAGNFADVIKHLILALCLEHLARKPAPFRVIDTHAGIGSYDLCSDQARRTGEWRDGIGRLQAMRLPDDVKALMAGYLAAVATRQITPLRAAAELREPADNDGQIALAYPGSPLIAAHFLRDQDTLIANELHPDDRTTLKAACAGDNRIKVMGLDGWIAIKSLLPPKERRGLILIDPPFEMPGEFDRLATGLGDGLARFATGTFILWYPIKNEIAVRGFMRAAHTAAKGRPYLDLQFTLRKPDDRGPLAGCGLFVANPPYTLEPSLRFILPTLREALSRDGQAHFQLSTSVAG